MLLPQVDLTYLAPLISQADLAAFTADLLQARTELLAGSGAGADFLGWLNLPLNLDTAELQRMAAKGAEIRAKREVLLVVGIGGSYLGARAALEYLLSPYANFLEKPQIFFLGNNLSASQLHKVLAIVGDRDFAVNVVSKSGTTAEPAIAFQVLKQLLEKRYGKEGAKERIIATTDPSSGALRALAISEGYTTFAIPPDVGGRYSLLTACGLLPLFAAGIDVVALLEGAATAAKELQTASSLDDNPAFSYVAARHALLARGKGIEFFGSYQPSAHMLTEWWKQLFGESEGKEGKGILPATLELTADLHSMGQYIQDGPRNLFSTILEVEAPQGDEILQASPEDVLHYLDGWGLNAINAAVQKAAALAHSSGGAPTIIIRTPAITPADFGALIYFFEFSCALSGYLLGVNPFDQPGVEAYKNELKQLLRSK